MAAPAARLRKAFVGDCSALQRQAGRPSTSGRQLQQVVYSVATEPKKMQSYKGGKVRDRAASGGGGGRLPAACKPAPVVFAGYRA